MTLGRRSAVLLPVLLIAWTLVILGTAVAGGSDTGPALPSLTTTGVHEHEPADVHEATAWPCQDEDGPREGAGDTQVRLRCTISNTQPLKAPDDPGHRHVDGLRARAAEHPRGHDCRPRASRTSAARNAPALLQVFRC